MWATPMCVRVCVLASACCVRACVVQLCVCVCACACVCVWLPACACVPVSVRSCLHACVVARSGLGDALVYVSAVDLASTAPLLPHNEQAVQVRVSVRAVHELAIRCAGGSSVV